MCHVAQGNIREKKRQWRRGDGNHPARPPLLFGNTTTTVQFSIAPGDEKQYHFFTALRDKTNRKRWRHFLFSSRNPQQGNTTTVK